MGALKPRKGRVFRCAWCHKAEPVRGGLLYYAYAGVGRRGRQTVVPADPARWSHSDGICPAHRDAAR
jgi:hypothetical protein